MTVTPIGVDHVALNVSDVPAAIDFYTNVLGLQIDASRPDFGIAGAWLDAGASRCTSLSSLCRRKWGSTSHCSTTTWMRSWLRYGPRDWSWRIPRSAGRTVARPS